MAEYRLVRISVREDGERDQPFLGYMWGLYNDDHTGDVDEFLPLYARSQRAIQKLK